MITITSFSSLENHFYKAYQEGKDIYRRYAEHNYQKRIRQKNAEEREERKHRFDAKPVDKLIMHEFKL